MPRDNSPVTAMLMEHDQGRAYVKAMEEAALGLQAGAAGRDRSIAGGYEAAESRPAKDFAERYEVMVAAYEREGQEAA